jgi:hypothetical protein
LDQKLITPGSTAGMARMNFRWQVIIWLLAGGIINYIDRASLSIAAPEMIRDLGCRERRSACSGPCSRGPMP